MENIKGIAAALCFVSAGIYGVRYLVSDSALCRKAEVILKMIFAAVLISPFVNGKFSFELPELSDYEIAEYSFSRDEYESELTRQASENISQVLTGQITASGTICEKVTAEVNISEDGSIIISKVIIEADDFEKAADIVKSCLGGTTEVVNGYP